MKAWEIRNGDLGLHDVEPAHANEGETVVRVSHFGICGSDVPKLSRPNGFTLPEPWRPGHEIVGTDPTGRAVAVDPLVPCGICPRCGEGNTHLRLVRDGGVVVVQNAYHPGVCLPTPLRDVFRRSISLIGSFSFCRRQRPGDFTLALDLLRDHAHQMATLVADAGQLAELPVALGGGPMRTIRQVLTVSTSRSDTGLSITRTEGDRTKPTTAPVTKT